MPPHVTPERSLYDTARALAESADEGPGLERILHYFEWIDRLEREVGRRGGGIEITIREAVAGDTLRLLGLRRRTSRGRMTIEILESARIETEDYLRCLGLSSAVLAKQFQANETAKILPPDDLVPVPMTSELWIRLFDEQVDRRWTIRLILAKRPLRQLHVGLSALDSETLAYVLARPRLVKDLASDDAAGAFSAFSRALRVMGDRVDPPGGERYAGIWSRAVGKPVSDPVGFAESLFRSDEGKLAYLYAVFDSIDEPSRAALLADESGAPSSKALEDLFDSVKRSSADWIVKLRPFSRTAFESGGVMGQIAAGNKGHSPLFLRRFWEKTFDLSRMPSDSDRLLRLDGPRLTLSSLIRWIFDDPARSRERFETFRFTQRYFAARPETDPAVLLDVTATARLFPALARAFERAGVTDPALYATAGRRAEALAASEEALPVRLRQWQGAIGIVETLHRSGAIDVRAAEMLLAAVLRPGPEAGIGISKLLRGHLHRVMGLLGPSSPPPDLEDYRRSEWHLLHAMSATRVDDGTEIAWDGVNYRVALIRSQAQRALTIARLQPRPTLDDVLSMATSADALAAAKTMAEVIPHREALSAISRRLTGVELPTGDPTKPWRPAQTLAKVMKDLSQVRRDKDAKRARNAAVLLASTADQLLADVIPALLYAARLGASVRQPEQVSDLWRRHDFGFGLADGQARSSHPWTTPRPAISAEQKFHVSGSLLGVDLALGSSLLREAGAMQKASGDGLSDADLTMISESLALWFAGAPARHLTPVPAKPAALESHFRAWAAVNDAGPRPDDPNSAIPFLSRVTAENCWCVEPVASNAMAARTLVERVGALPARIHATLDALGMPHVLAPLLAAAGWNEVILNARPMHTDDWPSIAAALRLLTPERLEELLFSLVATGELAPVTSGR